MRLLQQLSLEKNILAFKSFTPPERKIMKTLKTLLTVAALMVTATTTFAASHASAPMGMPMAGSTGKMDTAEMTDGEIRKVDMDNKKLTIKHGNIKNLDMPGMTMVFQVKDPAMLDKVKAGDKVKFSADKIDGAIVVTNIQPVK